MATLNQQTLTSIRIDVEKALKEIGDRHGIDLNFGHGSFTPSGLTGKLQIKMAARNDSSEKSGQQIEFEALAPRYGLTADDYGREFSHGRRRFKLIGINPNRPSNCLSIACVKNGTEYLLDLQSYRFAISMEDGGLLRKKVA
ncbi:hypothetical protein G6L37_07565 [Agrobacterium rubi]|nr:hypothetical protein [Agrobacterium rubi]NTF25226.1 hypothetical protein [Agrobacterium rubi]